VLPSQNPHFVVLAAPPQNNKFSEFEEGTNKRFSLNILYFISATAAPNRISYYQGTILEETWHCSVPVLIAVGVCSAILYYI
jgi:hypothetical protein